MEKVINSYKHKSSVMNSFLFEEVKEHFTKESEKYLRNPQRKTPKINIPEGKRVFEAGCGGQFLFNSASEKYAADITPAFLKGLKHKDFNGHLVICDARFLPFRANVFYVVVSIMLLHHLVGRTVSASKNNIELCLTELKRVSEKKSHIYIMEHVARNWFFSTLCFYTTLICSKLHVNLKYLDIHDKVITYYLNEKSMKRMIQKCNLRLKLIDTIPWVFRKIKLGEDKEFVLYNSN